MKLYFKVLVYLFATACFSAASAGAYDDFFSAVRRDDGRTAARLIERGFDPNSPDENGQPPLMLALRDGCDQIVNVLLQRAELNVEQANPADETPLMMAALRGRVDWVERLVARGAQVNRPGWSPLHYAASGGDVATLRWLLDHGAEKDARSPNSSTPLMMAAGYGSEDAADLLLARGADAARRNDKGLTAGDFARRAGRDTLAARLDKAAR